MAINVLLFSSNATNKSVKLNIISPTSIYPYADLFLCSFPFAKGNWENMCRLPSKIRFFLKKYIFLSHSNAFRESNEGIKISISILSKLINYCYINIDIRGEVGAELLENKINGSKLYHYYCFGSAKYLNIVWI